MAQRDSYADPYLVSGRSAAGMSQLHMKREALQRSIRDADEFERRGHRLLVRFSHRRLLAGLVVLAFVPAAAGLGVLAVNSYDGSYEGALVGSWSMLGFFVCVGGAMLVLSWLTALSRLRETGERLLRRAEYQRRIALLQLSEIAHEAVR